MLVSIFRQFSTGFLAIRTKEEEKEEKYINEFDGDSSCSSLSEVACDFVHFLQTHEGILARGES
jgi:hypothetical protein